MELTFTLEDLPEVATKLLSESQSKTFLFYGEMGAGKTTLIKEIAKNLDKLIPIEAEKRIANRIRKFSNMGVVNEGKK